MVAEVADEGRGPYRGADGPLPHTRLWLGIVRVWQGGLAPLRSRAVYRCAIRAGRVRICLSQQELP